MKASTYKQQARGQKMSRCDKKLGVTRVTPKPNRGREQLSLLTRMCKKRVTPSVGVTKVDLLGVTSKRARSVTATVIQSGIYILRLSMSKRKIKAVWLTVERVAELKGCSKRTVWRYISDMQLKTHKQFVKSGSRSVNKSFVLTNPELYELETAHCDMNLVTPSEFVEAEIEIDGMQVVSALIYGYAPVGDEPGGSDELL
ncbi:MAG: DNA-binding protein [Candidatus Cloacimonadaceae bacterium]|nr:helix-turn-helix domain-containing protein [Candidatus Cloacimonadota bacterium]MDD3534482.1 DNA-binding protein [Candidatus Cloacimonadota bacterium]